MAVIGPRFIIEEYRRHTLDLTILLTENLIQIRRFGQRLVKGALRVVACVFELYMAFCLINSSLPE